MNKYDYGYEISQGSTIEWAYSKVRENSTVLELGPSNGNLIYHLTTEKGCIADFVEIDEEAGKEADRFSRNSCIGTIEGNLELDCWYQKIKGNKYDYIIILDVLEHIRNPKEVLEKLKDMLLESGVILLSIPNIAHNSVIMQLLRDKFEYTSVGLLDDTHVHFYTYNSIKQMLREVGLCTQCEEVIQIPVGQNEIEVSYGIYPKSIESFLKTRSGGTVYQYLLTIRNGTDSQNEELKCRVDSLYEVCVFSSDKSEPIFRESINPRYAVKLEVNVDNVMGELRIDPLNANCIIENLEITVIYGDGKVQNLLSEVDTGIAVENKMIFFDDDPQIYISIPEGVKKIKLYWNFVAFENEALNILFPIRDIIRQYEADAILAKNLLGEKDREIEKIVRNRDAQIKEIIENKDSQIEEICRNKESQVQEILHDKERCIKEIIIFKDQKYNELKVVNEQKLADMNILVQDMERKIKELSDELNQINDTIWGKVYNKIYKRCGRKINGER